MFLRYNPIRLFRLLAGYFKPSRLAHKSPPATYLSTLEKLKMELTLNQLHSPNNIQSTEQMLYLINRILNADKVYLGPFYTEKGLRK